MRPFHESGICEIANSIDGIGPKVLRRNAAWFTEVLLVHLVFHEAKT